MVKFIKLLCYFKYNKNCTQMLLVRYSLFVFPNWSTSWLTTLKQVIFMIWSMSTIFLAKTIFFSRNLVKYLGGEIRIDKFVYCKNWLKYSLLLTSKTQLKYLSFKHFPKVLQFEIHKVMRIVMFNLQNINCIKLEKQNIFESFFLVL